MNLLESFRIAIRGLANNKVRTALTMLGMIIGVGVVILVEAIGEGATQRVTETVNSLGTNLLNISSNRNRVRVGTLVTRSATASSASTSNSTPLNSLTLADATLIAHNFPKSVEATAPQIDNGVQVRLGSVDAKSDVIGTTLDYPYVKNVSVARGHFFSQNDIDGSLKVCVVGPTVAEHLMGDAGVDLTGRTIAINRQGFLVLGMLTSRGATSWGQDQDDVILVPVTTAMRRIFNRRALDNIQIRCTTPAMMPLATEQISTFLRNRHHLRPPFEDTDDFRIRSQTDLLKTQQTVTGTMTTLLSLVAAISLVVGGIGIMNIMLVSVTERTREIGIRKAIGATPRDILRQFLIEAVMISLIGGMIGIGVGVGGAMLLASMAGWNTLINATAVFWAVVVSASVGIFFGIYPASKAASLHPIEALRFD